MGFRDFRFNSGLSYPKVHMIAIFKCFESNYDVYKQKGNKKHYFF